MEKEQSMSSPKITEDRRDKSKALRPMDELCGSVFFQDVACTQLLLQELLEKPDIKIREMLPQSVLPKLFGRDGGLNVIAFDDVSGIYKLEFQSDKEDAALDRAFLNYGLLTQYWMDKGTKFKDFPYTSIIFTREEGFFQPNQTKAAVKCVLGENVPAPLESKLNMIYVNTNARENETTISKILHDLRCSSPVEMLVPQFAARMEQIKNPKGKKTEFMCEALATERKEGRKEVARETASAMFAIGSSYEAVQALFHEVLSEEEIRQIQKTSTEHKKAASFRK